MRATKVTIAAALLLAVGVSADDAAAYTHVVSEGETLAQIAIRVYGSATYESAIASANALDAHGGSAIVPGLPLEIPAPSHYRAKAGDTWSELASRFLGDKKRADVLARANGGVAWVPPVANQEIVIPAVVPHIVAEGETMPTLAQRYLGDMNKAWELDAYNGRKAQQKLVRGDIVLVPLPQLRLTAEGRDDARRAAERIRSEGSGEGYEAQRNAEAELPPLLADIRAGRYVDAVARGSRLFGSGELTKRQNATIHRALLEAFVALDAPGLAAGACSAYRDSAEETVRLDPRTTSPKIRAACGAL